MKATLALVLLCTAPAVSAAQQPPPAILPLTLDDAVSRGLAASHRLAEGTARADAARAVGDERHAATLPQVAGQAGYTRTNHVQPFAIPIPSSGALALIYPDLPNNYRTRLDLQWPIYTGGRLDALERAARAEANAASQDVEGARNDLRLEITRAYWALVTAREAIRVVDEAVTRVEAHLRDVRNQFDVGLLPPNDVAAAEAQLAHQRTLAVQARTQREVAEIDLARLIGAPDGTPVEPAVALEPPPPQTASLETLVGEATRQRRDREALVTRVEAAAQRRDAAGAGRRPTVAVGGGFDYANPNVRIFPRRDAWQTSWDASVNLSWPLFDGGRTAAEMGETDALERAAKERLAEFDTVLSADVRARARELESSRAAIDAATEGVRSASEARRVLADRFAAGVATSTDVLEAQFALLQAELDRTQAIAAARLAEARLARALGR